MHEVSQVFVEPLGRARHDTIQGARLLEQVRRAGDTHQLLRPRQAREGGAIQFDDAVVEELTEAELVVPEHVQQMTL